MDRVLVKISEEMKRRRVRMHGAVLIKGGRVIDEVYNGRYTAETKTRMYSTTKSVTAVAIGKLIGEGRLSLDDKVVDIFADKFDMSDVDPLLREQTVRDMLMMRTVYSAPTYSAKISDWLASYFRAKPTHPAGTLWYYDSCGSYVLGAIVKHITGLDFVEYMRPEFDKMGVSHDAYCLEGPDGEAWVSSGLIATTADLARIAYLMLNKGRWNGEQLIPEDYAVAAISPLSRNDQGVTVYRYNCGYGYQIWAHPNGCFAFRGLGGQVAIGYPGRDLVFACTSDTSAHHNAYAEIFDIAEKYILPAFPIEDAEEYERHQPKAVEHLKASDICGREYLLRENPLGMSRVRFDETDGAIRFSYTKGDNTYSIDLAPGREIGIVFPERYSGFRVFDEAQYMNYECSVEAEWLEPRKLFVKVWAEDIYVGNMTLCFFFGEDGRIALKAEKQAQFFFDDFDGIAWGEEVMC